LPAEIHPLDVLFELDGLELLGVGLVYKLDGDLGPAQASHGLKTALTGDKLALASYDWWVDQTDAGDGLSELLKALELAAVTPLPIDADFG
jgi:hypothetical protein